MYYIKEQRITEMESVNNKPIKILIPITNSDLDTAWDAVWNDDTYGNETRIIRDCLKKYPNNTEKEIVAMKVGLIDVTNSTNISRYKHHLSVAKLVDLLMEIHGFDKRLEEGGCFVSKRDCRNL